MSCLAWNQSLLCGFHNEPHSLAIAAGRRRCCRVCWWQPLIVKRVSDPPTVFFLFLFLLCFFVSSSLSLPLSVSLSLSLSLCLSLCPCASVTVSVSISVLISTFASLSTFPSPDLFPLASLTAPRKAHYKSQLLQRSLRQRCCGWRTSNASKRFSSRYYGNRSQNSNQEHSSLRSGCLTRNVT